MKTVPLFILCLTFIGCQSKMDGDLLILNANIIDIETGDIKRRNLLIKDSIIALISEVSATPSRAKKIIDGSEYYLIPGLWDMHVHIQDSTYLSLFLDYGITGVRDMGGCVNVPTDGCESVCPEILNRWKAAVRNGTINGPRLFIAGTQLSGTGWPTSFAVSTREEISVGFEKNLRDQVDFIKVYEKIPWESYEEIARLAKLHKLDFVGHTSEPFLLSDILDLGQKSIEHLREPILYSFTKDLAELENFMAADNYTAEDREFVQPWLDDAENVIESFKRNQAWFTPTMAVEFARQRVVDTAWLNHPIRKKLPGSVTEGMYSHMAAMQTNEDKNGDKLWWMALAKLVKRFSEERIGILAGSDAACEGGIPGYSLHEELLLMVEEAGLPPLEALQTATINPCSFFGLEKIGKIHEGYQADMVLLKENPLENIRNTLSIKVVVKNGKIVRLN